MRPLLSVKKILFDVESYTGPEGMASMGSLQAIAGAMPLEKILAIANR